ncbi:unnamed protein product [Hanseniaspora opuntiae]|mgnify:FL=1|jgi:Ras-related protein Rap-1B
MREYKLIVLGAGGVGKSCLTVQYISSQYIDSYDPTIEDSYNKIINIDNRIVELEILDTAGIEQFTAMRELYIKNGDGFLLVYSVNDQNSFKELIKLREQILKIKGSNENCLMVLVGNKADLNYMERKVSIQDGIDLSESWGGIPFYETSALLRNNVDEVFIDLVRQIIRKEINDQKKQLELKQTKNFDNVYHSSNKSKPYMQSSASSVNVSSNNFHENSVESFKRPVNLSQNTLIMSGHMRSRSQVGPSNLGPASQGGANQSMMNNQNNRSQSLVNTGNNKAGDNMTSAVNNSSQTYKKRKNTALGKKKKSTKCVIM